MSSFKQLKKSLIKQGWNCSVRKCGHLKFVSPSGKVLFTSATPSDVRAIHKIRAQARRMGADL